MRVFNMYRYISGWGIASFILGIICAVLWFVVGETYPEIMLIVSVVAVGLAIPAFVQRPEKNGLK
jgi:uncharacterized membrane protein